jgi:hypothetical protein
MVRPDDKRLLFPFGANAPASEPAPNVGAIIARLDAAGISLRLSDDGESVLAKTKGKMPAWARALIAENKPELLHWCKVDDQRKREAAISKLPFAEFSDGPVELRSFLLLKIWDDYLAVTRKEAATLGWSDIDWETGAGVSGQLSPPGKP